MWTNLIKTLAIGTGCVLFALFTWKTRNNGSQENTNANTEVKESESKPQSLDLELSRLEKVLEDYLQNKDTVLCRQEFLRFLSNCSIETLNNPSIILLCDKWMAYTSLVSDVLPNGCDTKRQIEHKQHRWHWSQEPCVSNCFLSEDDHAWNECSHGISNQIHELVMANGAFFQIDQDRYFNGQHQERCLERCLIFHGMFKHCS